MPFDATPVELTAEQRVLREAAQRVRERGLWQAGVHGTASGVCAVLAIGQVADKARMDADGALDRMALLLGVGGHMAIAEWNDAPGRTAEEVAQALEAAAR